MAEKKKSSTKKSQVEAQEGHNSEASDADSPEVVENLSDSGQEALADMDEASKDEADLALDASGPLVLQHPDERVMTGAVSEEHAEAQKEATKDLPDDYVGEVTESGNLASKEAVKKEQEDVIDFPPPLAGREAQEAHSRRAAAAETGGFLADSPVAGGGKVYAQKGVFYTDGISGAADHNLERAYEIPEVLQSSNPSERKAGDESLSEAAKDDKTSEEKEQAEEVKSDQ
jgi:hypothetical protein